MIKVIETFSGIGAQAKALKRQKIEHQIIATADWDINAIMAYDLIHNGKQDLSIYNEMSKEDLLIRLKNFTLSPDGKAPYKEGSIDRINIQMLRRILCAIERSNNLVSITDMSSKDIPEDLDLLTYSFPCQDLSIAGVWHGNMSGIDRNIKNRSGMLWEVEKILKDCVESGKQTPKFLLMENVSNIMAPRHRGNFDEWISYLKDIGYYSKIYKLNAKKFGIPQNRERVYMISVYVGECKKKELLIEKYFENNDLNNDEYVKTLNIGIKELKDIVRNDYKNEKYKNEADISQMHDTPSRIKIVNDNDKILTKGKYTSIIKTITTKQDRNPNSGIIEYEYPKENRLNWRYLTPRECFLAMGFDENDFQMLMDNNEKTTKNRMLFSDSKLIKMAGNSIVVNVLEALFKQIVEIKSIIEE